MIDPLFKQLLIMKRKAMTPAQRRASYKQVLPKWLFPFQYEREYSKQIAQILTPLSDAVNELFPPEVLEGYVKEVRGDSRYDIAHTDGFAADIIVTVKQLRDVVNSLFVENPEPVRAIVSTIGFNVGSFNQSQWSKIVNKLLGINYIKTEAWETETVNMWTDENFNLIKNLADEVIKKISTGISQGVMSGKTAKEMEGEVQKLLKSHIGNYRNPGYRARLIARDQVGKLNGYFTQRRQTDVGIDKYEWSTAGDERVRTSHRAMDNKLCKWADASVMSSDGGETWQSRPLEMQGAIPGSQISCRCSALPWMNDIYGDIDAKID